MPDRKGLFIGIGLIIVVLASYVFYTKDLSSANEVIKTDISSKKNEISELKKKISEMEAAKTQFDLSTEVQRIESLKSVPTGLRQDEVIKDLVEIADKYDITLGSISFGKGNTDKNEVGSLRITSSFEGNYADLTDFLEGLEQNPRLFRVNTISVQVSELGVSDFQRANFSLSIDAFFQK